MSSAGAGAARGLKTDDRAPARLEQPDQFVHGHFDVPEDGTQQARTERFAGVHRDSGRSAVRMLEKNMTAARPNDREADFFEGADNLSSLGAGEPRHTEIC